MIEITPTGHRLYPENLRDQYKAVWYIEKATIPLFNFSSNSPWQLSDLFLELIPSVVTKKTTLIDVKSIKRGSLVRVCV